MEFFRSFLCPECNDLSKITDGDYLFSYNLECKQGHKKLNLEQDFLLKKREMKKNLFKCKNHRKNIHIHCYTCNEDICILCYKELHQNHKFDYLKNLTLNTREKYISKFNSQKQKEILQIFLTELNNFQTKLNFYIDTLKDNLKTQYEFRAQLIQNISENNFSFIDIENFNSYSKNEKYKQIEELIEGFVNKSKFLERYDYLKNILAELIKKGKYIEERKIVNRINNYIDLNLVPLNHNKLFVQCIKNYISENSSITIFKEIKEKEGETYDYKPIIRKTFPFIIYKCPILIENSSKSFNETSFYCISANSVLRIKLARKDVSGTNLNLEYDCNINMFQIFNIKALAVLSQNKNVVFNSKGSISLYDSNFTIEKDLNIKLPDVNCLIDNILTLDSNSLIFTLKIYNQTEPMIYTLYINKNNKENNEIGKINTSGLTPMPLFYFKQKKLLISLCYEYKYNNIKENNSFYISLINFAVSNPEIIQMININYYSISKKIFYFNCFDDECIYFPISQETYKKEMFYKVIYFSQYKLVKGEFMEISRIKKEDDLSMKRYNSYGS